MNGKELKAIRRELRLTQWDIANKLGITQSTISLCESGAIPIPWKLNEKIENLQKEANQ